MIMYLAVQVTGYRRIHAVTATCKPPSSAMAHLALGKAVGLDLLKHSSARHRVAHQLAWVEPTASAPQLGFVDRMQVCGVNEADIAARETRFAVQGLCGSGQVPQFR